MPSLEQPAPGLNHSGKHYLALIRRRRKGASQPQTTTKDIWIESQGAGGGGKGIDIMNAGCWETKDGGFRLATAITISNWEEGRKENAQLIKRKAIVSSKQKGREGP